MSLKPLFAPHTPEAPARCAVFLSGTGSNAEKILEYTAGKKRNFRPVLLLTDNPVSRAGELAEKYSLPLKLFDIKEFYASYGETAIRLDSPRRREIRDLWSRQVEAVLRAENIEIVLLAGFVPLINLSPDLPALNVHPGDLTIEDENGCRMLAGLHFKPVERAILAGFPSLRSSVISVQPYNGGSNDIDSGPVIGVSAPVKVELDHRSIDELAAIEAARKPGKVDDPLRQLAAANVEKLKINGDHVVFPQAVDDFAAGKFALDGKQLFYNGKATVSVEYSADFLPKLLTV